MRSPSSILVRGVNWLGDAVMTTPALQRLRERFPEARITLLTHEKLADLWLGHPSVDVVLTFDSTQSFFSIANAARLCRLKQGLIDPLDPAISGQTHSLDNLFDGLASRAARAALSSIYDIAVLFPNSHRSALEAWWTRSSRRIGFSRPWRNFLLTDPIPMRPGHTRMHKLSLSEIHRRITEHATRKAHTPSIIHHTPSTIPSSHQVHDYLHLVSTLGADPSPLPPLLVVQPNELEAVAAKFQLPEHATRNTQHASGIQHPATPSFHHSTIPSPPPLLALCPGAEYGPAKRWPLERFIAAAREIRKRTNCTWLLLGGKADQPLTAQIVSALNDAHAHAPRSHAPDAPRSFDLAGQTTLRELMRLLKLSRVLLTNDSGPMHVAAALGTPVVVPFGSTSPELTGPLATDARNHHVLKSDVPCSPCFLRACPIDLRCMTSITVESVVEAVLKAIG